MYLLSPTHFPSVDSDQEGTTRIWLWLAGGRDVPAIRTKWIWLRLSGSMHPQNPGLSLFFAAVTETVRSIVPASLPLNLRDVSPRQ
ncbi:unnamed protein product [Linum tenue]|uniref:Uncharacterized protein n=1 Tax=Linum tenue TaxID=586396 RepID=A0AAV0IUK1_9ROSI|nr:unnamed protein product [Linum tenue]CAI0540143.1 unnamed protein product [Linum tenue]CAI0560065.1 unnamed protein product [Linum tenue]